MVKAVTPALAHPILQGEMQLSSMSRGEIWMWRRLELMAAFWAAFWVFETFEVVVAFAAEAGSDESAAVHGK